ncbi:MAG: hypothetical protein ACT4PP_01960 [Sporichthyaceae bacterium]
MNERREVTLHTSPSLARTTLGVLRLEWIRLRSLRSTWLLALLALASAGSVAWFVARDIAIGVESLSDSSTVLTTLTGAADLGPLSVIAVLAGLVGVLAFGAEYRHGLMPATLVAVPRRGALLVAKLIVVAAFAASLAIACVVLAYTVARIEIGGAWTTAVLTEGSIARALAGYVALVVLTAVLGVSLAAMVRTVSGAAIALLAIPAVLEPALVWVGTRADLPVGDAESYLPFTAGVQMLHVPGADGPGAGLTPLDSLVAAGVLAGFVALVALVAAGMFTRRDA